MQKKKIFVLCGSTRKTSSNLNLIRAIIDLYQTEMAFSIYDGLLALPPFNPDEDTSDPSAGVADFRRQLKASAGVLICTPEYAMGVPGTLKNAIDWTVSSMEFSRKPVALITASSMGEKGHASLLETLKIIESDIDEDLQLLISHIRMKVSDDSITDPGTLAQVHGLMRSFLRKINFVSANS